VAHPDINTDQENRQQYLALLAAACARNAYDLSLFHWAQSLGLDLFAERSTYFDGLVRAERIRRAMEPPPGSVSIRRPQHSANERATDLLLENLTAKQRDQYQAHPKFRCYRRAERKTLSPLAPAVSECRGAGPLWPWYLHLVFPAKRGSRSW
jgi:hypothetical protein